MCSVTLAPVLSSYSTDVFEMCSVTLAPVVSRYSTGVFEMCSVTLAPVVSRYSTDVFEMCSVTLAPVVSRYSTDVFEMCSVTLAPVVSRYSTDVFEMCSVTLAPVVSRYSTDVFEMCSVTLAPVVSRYSTDVSPSLRGHAVGCTRSSPQDRLPVSRVLHEILSLHRLQRITQKVYLKTHDGFLLQHTFSCACMHVHSSEQPCSAYISRALNASALADEYRRPPSGEGHLLSQGRRTSAQPRKKDICSAKEEAYIKKEM